MNHIVFFSAGKSSFSVAHLVKEKYKNTTDNVVLYFTDTLWESKDTMRFLYEAADKLELPLLIHSRGITPPQLMVKQRFMANNRVGICSRELKMKVSMDYLKKGIVPEIEKWHNKHFLKDENFVEDATLYFGIGYMEAHREGPIRHNWQPFKVEMPLIDEVVDNDEILALYSIRQPLLYDQNFAHGNCAGKCIKGGQQHFLNLFRKNEKAFHELNEQEIVISEYIRYTKQPQIKSGKCKDYLYKDVYEFVSTGKKSKKIQHILDTSPYLSSKRRCFGVDSKGNPIKKPYTFMKSKSLRELLNQPIQYDIFDYGGCGCFVDF